MTIFTSDIFSGDGDKLAEMVLSIPEHSANVHKFPNNKHFKVEFSYFHEFHHFFNK